MCSALNVVANYEIVTFVTKLTKFTFFIMKPCFIDYTYFGRSIVLAILFGVDMKAYTTGEIAEFCGVTLRTVIRWIEKGHLKGYKLPGRGNNRVLPHDLLEFLNQQNMPIPAELKNQPKRERVLIIDDDEAIARAIQRVVTRMKLSNEIAFDGFEAGHKIHSFDPSLLLLDLQMPGIDGYKIITKLRDTEKFKDIKIIVVSGSNQSMLDKAMALGADACIGKPFMNEDLQLLIEQLLNGEDKA